MQTLFPIQRYLSPDIPSGDLLRGSWDLVTKSTTIIKTWKKSLNGLEAFNILTLRVSHKPRSAYSFYKESKINIFSLADCTVSVTTIQLCHHSEKIAR